MVKTVSLSTIVKNSKLFINRGFKSEVQHICNGLRKFGVLQSLRFFQLAIGKHKMKQYT